MKRALLICLAALPFSLMAQITQKDKVYRNLVLTKVGKEIQLDKTRQFSGDWALGYCTPLGLHTGIMAETSFSLRQKSTLRTGRDWLFRTNVHHTQKTTSLYTGALLYRQAGFHTGFLPYARLDFGRLPGTKMLKNKEAHNYRFTFASGPWLGALTTLIPGPVFEQQADGSFSKHSVALRSYACPGYHLRMNVRVSPVGQPLHLLQFRADAALPLNWGAGLGFLSYFGLAYSL